MSHSFLCHMDQGASHLHAAHVTASNGALSSRVHRNAGALYLLLPRTLFSGHHVLCVYLHSLKYNTPSPWCGFWSATPASAYRTCPGAGGDVYQRSEKDVTLQDGCCHRPSLRCSGRGPGHMHVCAHFQWSGSLPEEQPCSVMNVALLFYAVKCILTSPTLHLDLKNFPDSLVSPRPSLAGIYYVINKCLPPCFPVGLVVKNPPFNARDTGSIPGWGRSPGGGNGNRAQHSCLENPMDRGAWRATVHGVEKSGTRLKQRSRQACTLISGRANLRDDPFQMWHQKPVFKAVHLHTTVKRQYHPFGSSSGKQMDLKSTYKIKANSWLGTAFNCLTT